MALCPFKKQQCSSECSYFAAGVKKCCFAAQTMMVEDLHKLSLTLLDNAILKEDEKKEKSQ